MNGLEASDVFTADGLADQHYHFVPKFEGHGLESLILLGSSMCVLNFVCWTGVVTQLQNSQVASLCTSNHPLQMTNFASARSSEKKIA